MHINQIHPGIGINQEYKLFLKAGFENPHYSTNLRNGTGGVIIYHNKNTAQSLCHPCK